MTLHEDYSKKFTKTLMFDQWALWFVAFEGLNFKNGLLSTRFAVSVRGITRLGSAFFCLR